jgi:DNA-binding response OmpR family regulator
MAARLGGHGAEALLDSSLILVVDDDPASLSVVGDSLQRAGFRVELAGTASQGLSALFASRPDAVILDLGMPGIDGWTLISRIREMSQEVPMLVLSGLNTPGDRIRSFTLGADDFIGKPFLPSELIARTRALLRRAGLAGSPLPESKPMTYGWLTVDVAACRVHAHGEEVTLTPQEFRLLVALARRHGAVCSHDELIASVWGVAPGVDARGALSVLISRLRKRLGNHPSTGRPSIESVRGFGYRLPSESTESR